MLRAIRKGKSHLQIPLIAKIVPAMKLLPVPVQDAILRATGFSGSMDGFKVRG